MPLVAPAKPKATIVQNTQGLEIIIPAKRNWFVTLFLGVWLCGWAFGEIVVPTQFFARDAEPGALLFTAVWLILWTIGGGFALYVFFWSLAGRERIVLTTSRLAIKRKLFGMGRVREYDLAHVRDLRVSPSPYNPFNFRSGLQFWGVGGGVMAFDHGAATVRFGAALEESEAKSITEQLRARGSFASPRTV